MEQALLEATALITLPIFIVFGAQVDNAAYDLMFRLYRPKPWQTKSAILSVDEATLVKTGGMRHA